MMKQERQTRKIALESISAEFANKESFISYLADIHLINQMLSKNSTINFHHQYENSYRYSFKDIKQYYCSNSVRIRYHPNLRPKFERSRSVNPATYQYVELFFHKEQL